MTSDDVFIDDVVTFTYGGGSDPGSKRLVLALNGSTNSYVKAWDFDREDLRTFSRNKMSNVRLLDEDEIKRVNLDCLPSSFGKQELIDGFTSTGYKCFASGDLIIAVKPKYTAADCKLRGYASTREIQFEYDNNRIALYIQTCGKVSLFVNDTLKTNDTNAADLANIFLPF